MGTKLIKLIHSQALFHNSRLWKPRKSCCTEECGASVIGGLQFSSWCCKGQSCVCLPPYACGSEIATSRCEVLIMGSLERMTKVDTVFRWSSLCGCVSYPWSATNFDLCCNQAG